MSWKAGLAIVATVAAVTVAIVLVVGGDNSADAKETDGAFITEMIPHHESAIEMAEIALDKAQHPETKQLADSIIESQGDEIEQLESIHERLFAEPASAGDHGTLGLPAHESGIEADMAGLEQAKPFAHHQGAIRMARVQISEGEDAELSGLAESIIEAQSQEIVAMNQWRVDWYGAPSPAGGVPPEAVEGEAPSHEAMGH